MIVKTPSFLEGRVALRWEWIRRSSFCLCGLFFSLRRTGLLLFQTSPVAGIEVTGYFNGETKLCKKL